ncbi:threonine ammonia-lyase IlvA [Tenacibaculum piscium]|uniref:L-threonine dehydratase n=1 Tax=Tenacibaculum piscium TaxID=1458515 RepID=A0A2H1YHE6_9FLAO|nr:threonine ammonia-lyase IlvA [Tenacibaculum piscium]MBE7630058.1 threonine ammonia-lyase IlvA [Tenacibaculum piscium]MBE7671033.1 threonine ammonia-lyase IlvA [Tenacibaculum piscium]MBE7690858.1 threonine ammonia-lyase IlvA [Tenacibaculum piscium]SOS74919.1 threonine ammonia-lyase [Tenacibaculum piscium]
MLVKTIYTPTIKAVEEAVATLKDVAIETPLLNNYIYSEKYKANIFLKREDLQQVRSYKIRGAYNKISSITQAQRANGIVCASAGNHAQGVAFACKKLQIHGTIVMPAPTPKQKVEQVKMFGGDYVDIQLSGDTFDDAYKYAKNVCDTLGKTFVHPFDDQKIIEGQATVGLEIIKQSKEIIDYVFVPVGGGGLASGVSSIFKLLSPTTKVIGVEPAGAASMKTSIEANKNVKLAKIDKFIDGAAVQQVGKLTFDICKENLYDMITVPEGKVCQTILDLYNKEAIVVEPAGALTITALDFFAEEIKGKNVVCVISGSNNDIARTAEIKERALLYSELKHYFIIRFPQRAGALKDFLMDVLGENDDITFFEYSKKSSKENAPAVVGIELMKKEDLAPLIQRMKALNFYGEYLNDKPNLFEFLV